MYHVLYYDDAQLIHVSMMELPPPPPPPPPHQPETPFSTLSLSLSLSLSQDHTQSASTALQATESLTCLPLLAFSHSVCRTCCFHSSFPSILIFTPFVEAPREGKPSFHLFLSPLSFPILSQPLLAKLTVCMKN
ncbi:hypothetical protein TorRG33x02_331050 [Trema orientale]|uniref:Uncharacterized protein n=1 Tax=Trema orientale TaxID=63057 RepID=A0A2P5B645_TREOI|nr:hypothetical protein TorRG33x02_331050 [Trema orientale]